MLLRGVRHFLPINISSMNNNFAVGLEVYSWESPFTTVDIVAEDISSELTQNLLMHLFTRKKYELNYFMKTLLS